MPKLSCFKRFHDKCSADKCSADNCFAEICSEHAEGMTFAPPTIIAPLKYAPKIIHAPQQYFVPPTFTLPKIKPTIEFSRLCLIFNVKL